MSKQKLMLNIPAEIIIKLIEAELSHVSDWVKAGDDDMSLNSQIRAEALIELIESQVEVDNYVYQSWLDKEHDLRDRYNCLVRILGGK